MTLAVIGACCTLAACGSSASSATSSGSTSSSAGGSSNNGTPAAKGAQGGRFTALRSCLAKQGINLPAPSGKRPQGGGAGGGGLLGGGGGGGRFQPPAGVSAAQFQEALKKCGGGNFGGAARFNSATARAALPKFAACMRENGVNLPAPNTSGNGPVFNTKGLNTASAQFRSAQAKCQPILVAARGQGGTGSGAPGAGAPGAGPPASG
ncbi:MAG: hypothetical protein JWN81_1406 [Solirubrobacterales bacterium]|nr:hypothetical protein [Solirubrobacterales bacterium]